MFDNDVEQVPSPDDLNDDDLGSTYDPDYPDVDDADKSQDDRSWKEVRGELIRKLEDTRRENREMLDRYMDRIEQKLERFSVVDQQPIRKDPNDPESYSIQELEAFRDKIPDENKVAFELYLSQRKSDARVDQRFRDYEAKQKLDSERSQYDRAAIKKFPDLEDESSEFARKVAKELRSVPEHIRANNPRIVYDVANEVALDMGVSPNRRRTVSGKPAPSRTRPSATQEENLILSDERRSEIAQALAAAMPRGTKFDMNRIKERERLYSEDERALRHQGGKFGGN